jgi:hypothetical protein
MPAGAFALQAHDPSSTGLYRNFSFNIKVQRLP